MKKLSLLLALMMVLSISVVSLAANWVDGSYVGYSDANNTSFTKAKVFIENGKIAAVILQEITSKHVEKDWATYPWPQAADAAKLLSNQFVANQAPKVDNITGATHSVAKYEQAVARALVKADPTAETGKYFDGTFLGRSESGARKYYEVVWVTIKNDQITDLRIERVLENHDWLNPADYNWPLEAARETYKELLIGGGHPVDIITGATGSTKMWNIAVWDALDKARVR